MRVKILGLVFLLLSIMIIPVSCVDNSNVGDLTIAYVDATDSIPDTLYVSSVTKPQTWSAAAQYNETIHATEIVLNSTLTGSVFCGGFVPASDTTYSFDIGLLSTHDSANIEIVMSNSYLSIRKYSSGNYRITGYYSNDTNDLISSYFTIPAANISNNHVLINVTLNDTTRNNTISCDGQTLTIPYKNIDGRTLPYPAITTPLVAFHPYTPYESTIKMQLYSITQTIPKKIITPYGYNNYTGFGLDYPKPDTNYNGTAYLHNNNCRSTVWADVGFLSDPNYVNYTRMLIDDYGFDLGVHYHHRLTDKSYEEACNDIDNETEQIYNTFGRYPTSFCSLQNADNVSHARYAYEKYGILWRNGASGVRGLPSVGNYYSVTSPWWAETYSRGALYPVFTHDTDDNPSTTFGITPDQLYAYVSGYKSNNVDIVGFNEYYKRNLNQNNAVVAITRNDGSAINYDLATTGFPSNVHMTSSLTGWVMKSRNGVTESIFETDGEDDFVDQKNGSYAIIKLPFYVVSDGVDVNLLTWSNTQKVWTLSSETQQSVTHTIGDLPANTDIQIKRDDINYETVTSNETGYIEWVYDGGFSEHTFSIERHDFNASLTSGAYPLTTQFTTSSDGIDAYYWDFENDGIIDSTKQNPAHTYGQTGDYSVNLTVHTSEGNVSTVKPDYITVENPAFSEDPLAWFNWVFSYLFGRF